MQRGIVLNPPAPHSFSESFKNKNAIIVRVKDENGQINKYELYVHSLKEGPRVHGEGMLNFFGRSVPVRFDIGQRNSFIYFVE